MGASAPRLRAWPAMPRPARDTARAMSHPSEFPLQGPFHGPEGARTWAREVWEVFSGVHHEVEEVIDVGDGATVISVQRAQGRTRHMQLDTNLQWAGVFTFRGGKVLRAQGYMSKAEALEAAGLSE
jgi:ketosteroid isomerase-like protein